MEKEALSPADPFPVLSRPPACGNRLCDLCTETRCRMLRREEDEPPSSADTAKEAPRR